MLVTGSGVRTAECGVDMRGILISIAAMGLALCAPSVFAQKVGDTEMTLRKWASIPNISDVAFIPSTDNAFLVQRNTGKVFLQSDNKSRVVLDLPVANAGDQGLLSVALHPDFAQNKLVYLNYIAAGKDGGKATANRIDAYRWTGKTLSFVRRVENLAAPVGKTNVGSTMLFGQDDALYAILGDSGHHERTQNYANSKVTSLSSVITRVNADGSIPADNPFTAAARGRTTKAQDSTSSIYAYGIRQSRGMDMDPWTGRIWDSEIGNGQYDELNLISPGFNSGWQRIMGPLSRNGFTVSGLANLGPASHYDDPKFSWHESIDPTAMAFVVNGSLGADYNGDLFVASKSGAIYRFDLNAARDDLLLSGPLADGVADNQSELFSQQTSVLFGKGFGPIVDIEQGPDGLYVVTQNTIYRVRSRNPVKVPEPGTLLWLGLSPLLLRRSRRRS
jgi:aldose sugar dehydrogenase